MKMSPLTYNNTPALSRTAMEQTTILSEKGVTGASHLRRVDSSKGCGVSVASEHHIKRNPEYASGAALSADSFGSGPEVEYYNNYAPNGMLYGDMNTQADVSIEPQSAPEAKEPEPTVSQETMSKAADKPMTELDRLVQALKENEEYSSKVNSPLAQSGTGVSHLDLCRISEWRALGLELIKNMSKEDYELLQKMFWSTTVSVHASNHELRDKMILKDNYKDYDLVAIWDGMGDYSVSFSTSTETTMGTQLRFELASFLSIKMMVDGLSDAERALSPLHALVEKTLGPNTTFTSRMGSVAEYVNTQYEEAKQTLASTNRYTIKFNNDFTFRVHGGTYDNAEFLQDVLNNAGDWLLRNVLDAIFWHRGEGGAVSPLVMAMGNNIYNLLKELAEERGCGYIQASKEYMEWLSKLSAAYSRKNIEDWLQSKYGFGLDDLVYDEKKKVLSGRTEEITNALNNDMWLEREKDEIIRVMKLPRENDLSTIGIIFENGEFSIQYFEEELF